MNGNRLVLVGGDHIYQSTDSGTTWWEQVLSVDTYLNDIIYTGTSFLAVGDGGITVAVEP